jgi:sporulation integral membrane protein YtvI
MNIFVNKILFVAVFSFLVIASIWLGIRLFFILIPFLIAYFFSKPLSWLVKKIHTRIKLPQNVLSLVVVVAFIAIFLTGISFGVYKGVTALRGISELLDTIVSNISDLTARADLVVFNVPWNEEPLALSDILFQFYDVFLGAISQITNSTINVVVSIARALPGIGIFIFFLFISLYFLTKDHDKVTSTVNMYLSRIKSNWINQIRDNTFHTIKQYLKAQLIIISITFLISFIGLTILGIPFSFLIAAAVAFVDLIPMVGPAFIYMPWIVLIILMNEYSTAFGLFIIYLASTVTRQVIEPKIVSSKIGTHPLIMLFSMYTCYRFVGIPGLIIGPIIVMFVLISIKAYKSINEKDEH